MKSLKNKIIIYPTDTVYGIGCDATKKELVEEIRNIKGRDNKPFSVIAPSIEWIKQNLIVDIDLNKYLPGPYTLILKKKNPEFLKHVSETDSLGVRIPNNEFCLKLQRPFITTSVNFSGQSPATKISEIPKEIKNKVDKIIPATSNLTGNPSTLIINGKEFER